MSTFAFVDVRYLTTRARRFEPLTLTSVTARTPGRSGLDGVGHVFFGFEALVLVFDLFSAFLASLCTSGAVRISRTPFGACARLNRASTGNDEFTSRNNPAAG